MRHPTSLFVFAFFCLAALVRSEPLLPHSSPEAQGVSSVGLKALLEDATAQKLGLHGLVVVRNGRVISEGWWAPYSRSEPHMLYSLSKSFTSVAVGIAQAEGRLDIHDLVLKYFPEYKQGASENLQRLRIRDLLMMSTGQLAKDVDAIEFAGKGSIVSQFMAAPVTLKPGTHFYYNTAATYMLSAIVQKVSGQSLTEYLQPRLFAPLGIERPEWEVSEEGIVMGGFGLKLTTGQIAAFGQMLLQRGEYGGRRLVPADYVDLATSRQVSNGSDPQGDWDQGYGFQFWRCVPGFYRGDGAFGQFCIVIPQHNTVVAINSGTSDMGAVMKFLWTRLLPELRAAALPENPEALAELRRTEATLVLAGASPVEGAFPGGSFAGKSFRVPANPWGVVSIRVLNTGEVSLTALGGGQVLPGSAGAWTPAGPSPLMKMGLSLDRAPTPSQFRGGWQSGRRWEGDVAFQRTPYVLHLVLEEGASAPTLTLKMNAAFGPNEPTVLPLAVE